MTKKILDDSIKYLSNKWLLNNLRSLAMPEGTNCYVAAGYSSKYKSEVVLKVCISDTQEQKALQFFNGNGCVKLLDYDSEHQGLLLEYIKPGISLKSLFPAQDDKAIEITAEIIKKLQVQDFSDLALKEFKTINQWLSLLDTFKSKKIPDALIQKARKLSKKLLSEQSKLYLLHGDLHHENILQHDNSWVAIDPKGVIGELAYEIGPFIRNPIPELLEQKNAREIIINRIEQFDTIFSFDKQRLVDWSFVQAILAACWAEQDKSARWHYFVEFAEIIKTL